MVHLRLDPFQWPNPGGKQTPKPLLCTDLEQEERSFITYFCETE